MSPAPHPIAVSSDSESEDPASPTSDFALTVMPMSPATDRHMQRQQWLPASDSENPSPASSPSQTSQTGPIRRRRRVRRLQPYEPEPFGRLFRRHEGGPVYKITDRKRVCAPADSAIPLPTLEHMMSV